MAGQPQTDAVRAERNVRLALVLLRVLAAAGLRHLVVCPGSRSAPLAVAAGLIETEGVNLHTALDERSAAFFALGLGRAEGSPAAVITTSGSAVANLLPACVEADHGAIPLLLLTADRPARLKGCGANQSVNQELFLRPSCRWVGEGPADGLDRLDPDRIGALGEQAMACCLGPPAGAVHLNLPFEEPLHIGPEPLSRLLSRDISPAQKVALAAGGASAAAASAAAAPVPVPAAAAVTAASQLDPDRAGVVVAGPWRGTARQWPQFLAALQRWQQRTGWPLLADALSGLRGQRLNGLIAAYDLLLAQPDPRLDAPQVLRLGPLPASRRLQDWLLSLAAVQEQVCEADGRNQDPLGRVRGRWGCGLHDWLALGGDRFATGSPQPCSLALRRQWLDREQALQQRLDGWLAERPDTEPSLARQLSRMLPPDLPLMLANSSPVRDWESFSHPEASPRPVFCFRGASGIDGTLSQACGLAEALGSLLLVCGDLALLHDSNGWLLSRQLSGRLTLVVIDNGGGGIFEQLPIRTDPATPLDFERLFAMPQAVDPLALAACHGAAVRRLGGTAELAAALAWALEHPLAVLLLQTDRRRDAALRRQLRTMAADVSSS